MQISLNYCNNKNFTSRFGSSTDYMTFSSKPLKPKLLTHWNGLFGTENSWS